MSIRIMMVDDHELIRQVFCRLLQKNEDYEIVGEADDGTTAIALALKLRPDIVLMDVHMPNMDGIEATRQILSRDPSIKVIGFSINSTRQIVTDMFSSGARGYLLKETEINELRECISTVMKGDKYLSPKIETGAVGEFA
jgi:DNA-binding NarL/FixJ family response regulator